METRATLEARFGPDPANWPAPWRGMAEGDLLQQALLVDGDETELRRAVLTRLARPAPALWPGGVPARLATISFAALWLGMSVFGYQLAGGLIGDPVLDLAMGVMPGWEFMQ